MSAQMIESDFTSLTSNFLQEVCYFLLIAGLSFGFNRMFSAEKVTFGKAMLLGLFVWVAFAPLSIPLALILDLGLLEPFVFPLALLGSVFFLHFEYLGLRYVMKLSKTASFSVLFLMITFVVILGDLFKAN